VPEGAAQEPLAVNRRGEARHLGGVDEREIAEALFLSSHTIKTHINRIFAKTGSRDRMAAAHYARAHGLV